jgi:hypothetical protein
MGMTTNVAFPKAMQFLADHYVMMWKRIAELEKKQLTSVDLEERTHLLTLSNEIELMASRTMAEAAFFRKAVDAGLKRKRCPVCEDSACEVNSVECGK